MLTSTDCRSCMMITGPYIRLSHPIRIGKTDVYATKERP